VHSDLLTLADVHKSEFTQDNQVISSMVLESCTLPPGISYGRVSYVGLHNLVSIFY